MIKAIIFDCFGVLIEDSLKQLMDNIRTNDPAKGQQLTEILHAAHRGKLSSEETNQRMSAGLDMSLETYHQWLNEGEIQNQQLLDYIGELHKTYRTAILSNISLGGIKRRFSDELLASHFDTVVASAEEGYAKPEPEIYEIAADRLGVRFDECVFTDDREEFCEAARSVGMQSITFLDFAQFQRDLNAVLADAQQ